MGSKHGLTAKHVYPIIARTLSKTVVFSRPFLLKGSIELCVTIGS